MAGQVNRQTASPAVYQLEQRAAKQRFKISSHELLDF
jgi:hypothetical protein